MLLKPAACQWSAIRITISPRSLARSRFLYCMISHALQGQSSKRSMPSPLNPTSWMRSPSSERNDKRTPAESQHRPLSQSLDI